MQIGHDVGLASGMALETAFAEFLCESVRNKECACASQQGPNDDVQRFIAKRKTPNPDKGSRMAFNSPDLRPCGWQQPVDDANFLMDVRFAVIVYLPTNSLDNLVCVERKTD